MSRPLAAVIARFLPSSLGRAVTLATLSLATLTLAAITQGCPAGGVGATCEIGNDCAAGLVCCTDCGRRGFCRASCDGVLCDDAHVDQDAASTAPDAFTAPDAADVDGGT